MTGLHPDAELAPRDIVARGVFSEIAAGRGAFLDARKTIGTAFPERFPTVTAACRAAGIDPVTDLVPVAPAAHYHMGGVLTDGNGRTTLDGLWACGEVASTGAHGANRLASNSLLEAVVFAARIAEDVKSMNISPRVQPLPSRLGLDTVPPEPGEAQLVMRLRQAMSAGVGVLRERAGLIAALAEIDAIEAAATGRQLGNMAVAARLVAAAALAREESRGGHYRADFPEARGAFERRSLMTLSDATRIAAEARPAAMVAS